MGVSEPCLFVCLDSDPEHISSEHFYQVKSLFITTNVLREIKCVSILSSSQFLILPQLPQKIKLASEVVKVDSKIIILLPKI